MKSRKNYLWLMVTLLWLVWGCAGPSAKVQVQPEELAAQLQTPKSELQQKLLAETGRSILADYKDYTVGSEDLVEFIFFGQDELNREVRVNGQGEVTLPLVGSVKVAGLTTREIEKKLRQLYIDEKYLRNPQIIASVKQYRHQRVMVTGAVVTPGSYEMIGPRTLLEMLGKAGGLSDKAGTAVHIIRRQNAPEVAKAMTSAPVKSFAPGTETIVVDLRRLLMGGAADLNYPIKTGDVIYVPPAEMAYVLGAVKKPGAVPLKKKLTVTQAVAICEGLDPVLSSNNISIIRLDEQGQRVTIPVHLGRVTKGEDPDPQLKPNDIVFVQESFFRRFFYDLKNMVPGSLGLGATVL